MAEIAETDCTRRLKQLHIQVQPSRVPGLDEALLSETLGNLDDGDGLVVRVRATEGVDTIRYMNFDYWTNDMPQLWRRVVRLVLSSPTLVNKITQCSIIVCEGDQGWDDYLLLHHFDATQSLDSL